MALRTFFAGAADKLNGEQIPYSVDALAYTRYEPVGVVAAILPWNSPISLASWKLGPGLAAGNAIILKPSEYTPASMVALARLIEEAGFPAGVVNVLPGEIPRPKGSAATAVEAVRRAMDIQPDLSPAAVRQPLEAARRLLMGVLREVEGGELAAGLPR